VNTNAAPYRVPPEPGRWRAFVLAMLMHALLLGFLWIGVSWQSTAPVAIEAEIWSPQVKLAAPPPPPPPEPPPEPAPPPKPALKPVPPPKPVAEPEPKAKLPDPDIALEREKKRKEALEKKQAEEQAQREEALEKQRQAELEKQRQAELEKKKQADEQKRRQEAAAEEKRKQAEEDRRRLAEEEKRRQEETVAEQRAKKRREDELKRLQALAGEGTAGDAEKAASPRLDPGYARLIAAKIKSNTILPPLNEIAGNPAVEYAIDLLPDGSVREVKLLRSSGVPAFDQAVRRAIDRAAPFPADPASGKVPGSMAISHRPKDQ
jgi:colicin import membrane protein